MSSGGRPVNDVLNEAWAWLVQKLLDWALGSFEQFLTWWIAGSGTAYNVQLTGEKGGVLYDLRLYTNWLTAAFAFAGFLVAAFRIVVQRKGAPFRDALVQFFELALIILTLATIVNLANMAGDQYSRLIIEHMKPKDAEWQKKWQEGVQLIGGGDKDDVSFVLAFFAAAAALSSVIQFVLMLFRNGALIVVVGILPAVAASRFTSYGNAAYRRCIGLLVSFIIVKPVIATIDAVALKLMTSPYEADRLFGLALVAGSVLAMPATLRAVMPAATEGQSFFGIRQVGHFAYGGTSVTIRSRGLSLLGAFVPGGGSRPGGSGGSGAGSGGALGGARGGGGGGGGRGRGGRGGGRTTTVTRSGPGGGGGAASGATTSDDADAFLYGGNGSNNAGTNGSSGSTGSTGGPSGGSGAPSSSNGNSSTYSPPSGGTGASSVPPYQPPPYTPPPPPSVPNYTPPPPDLSGSGGSGRGNGGSGGGPSGSGGGRPSGGR
jgi:hypothetical protein